MSKTLTPEETAAAELAMQPAFQSPYRFCVRVTRPDGPLAQTLCSSLPDLIAKLESGWELHAGDK